jgi:AraC family transcriptional regulator, transcriptional activator of pobA
MGRTRERGKRGGGLPFFTFEAAPEAPLVSTLRFDRELAASGGLTGPHSHDFLTLAYFQRDGGRLRSGKRMWELREGDAFVIPPGEVHDPRGLAEAEGWAVFFPAEVLAPSSSGVFLSWRSHPLLFPFVAGVDRRPGGSARRLIVPEEERPIWSTRLSALDRELREHRDGHREAALAYLTLLLVGVSRLAAEVEDDLRLNDEPLLAEVFGFVEERYGEPVSLKDVARAVSLSPGYLTTVVRRKTGRTVVEWIAERRMAQARRLLVETDLAVEEVGHRVGYRDPGYFVRTFRRSHGTTPLGWRRAGRP